MTDTTTLKRPPALVAFDVDGTLLRGETVCDCLARKLGRAEEMKAFNLLRDEADLAVARRTMVGWYGSHGRDVLLGHLSEVQLAPGVREGLARLRGLGIKTALVSLTWQFAVDWLAADLGADYAIGSGWLESGEVQDFWAADKARWLEALLGEVGSTTEDLVAVGDSAGDIPMLTLAGRGYFVGGTMPELPGHVQHWPEADIQALVEDMLAPVS